MPVLVPGIHTAADLLAAPYRDLDCELWDGTLMVHDHHGGYCTIVVSRLVARLVEHADERHLGWVGESGGGFRLRQRPDRVLVPDASFTSRERMKAPPARGFARAVPDLVAEVRSPRDTWASVVAKGGVWIGHGVRVVWLIDPAKRTVFTLHPPAEPVLAGPNGTFSGAPALPELSIAVADLFQGLP